MRQKFKLIQLSALFLLPFIYSCEKTPDSIESIKTVETVKTATFTPLLDTIYLNETVRFEATDTTGGLHYQWDFGDGTSILGGYKITHKYMTSGIHNVKLEIDKLSGSAKIKVYRGNLSYQIKNESSKTLDIFSYIDNWNDGNIYRFELPSGAISDTLYATVYNGDMHGFNISIFASNTEYSLSGFDSKSDWIYCNTHTIRTIENMTKCNYRIQNGLTEGKFFYIKDL